MKKLTRKLFLSVFTLFLTAATLGSVTFAWMSLNSEAWVEGMQFQATGGDGFLISVDNNIYKTSLSKEDIVKSIVKNYSNDLDSFDEYGNLVDSNKQIISNYEKIMEDNIKLYPCTSYGSSNQFLLTKLTGEVVNPSDGEYVQFDIFFKPTSEIKRSIDVYLNGQEDRKFTQKGVEYEVPQTKITASNLDEIKLPSDLTTYILDMANPNYGEAVSLESGDILKVRSSNAVRLGFKSDQDISATIVELSDEYDLGSYSTNIKDYTEQGNPLYDEEMLYDVKYDATKNAMFTFYNGLKNDSLTAIDYHKMPVTVTSLLNEQGKNRVKVCSLGSEGNEVKVTFKIWLEGWDADSIEGIAEKILVQLAFAQL